LIAKLITDKEKRTWQSPLLSLRSYAAELERKRSLRVGFRRWFWRPVQIRE
jgi:hypothetical protein